MTTFTWGSSAHPLYLSHTPTTPVAVSCSPLEELPDGSGTARSVVAAAVEILAVGEGRALASTRIDRTRVGRRLRYVMHRQETREGLEALTIEQRDETLGLTVLTRLERFNDLDAYRVVTTVRNDGPNLLTLLAVGTVGLSGLAGFLGDPDGTRLWTARNEWCAENRWSTTPLTGPAGLPDMNPTFHHHPARGSLALTATSTWSSGEYVPVAALEHPGMGRALAWQLENNGPWRWEINSQDARDPFTLELTGPTELHHGWATRLAPGATFTTVPASFALSDQALTGAVAQLTAHRRRSHIPTTADAAKPLVFNDYMNALMGDPSTERLLPLIDAARAAGAEYFCIDAGWYDDDGDWWPSVGAWEPSKRRFGDLGLTGVLQYIHDSGLGPGLWVEPEVIGVRSPMADVLPEECFMHRLGARIVEHDRYFLDLRSPAARDYLDRVFDRLVGQYGARYFKWDYNVTPGTGPDDQGATSPGEGLLDHTRAHLAWFESLRERHPDVIFEACSSGALRMDQAILTRYDLQSTSDQQDYRLYPTIAAGAPMALVPEQAGNWAYPQSEMTDEQIAFTLVTGLSGRLYLSGNLDKLDGHQLEIVREATGVYHQVLDQHARAVPAWPTGLPAWTDPFVSLASVSHGQTLVFAWNRSGSATTVDLALPHLAGSPVDIEPVFPTMLPAWPTSWDETSGTLSLELTGAGESARVLRLVRG
jgi:alpha-galactosidase